jgi:hypothetical protein
VQNSQGGQGCKAQDEALWVVIRCTPDGFIVHLKEYVGAESLPQRYFFLSEILQKAPSVKLVIHDDACHLRKYADGRKGDSEAAKLLAFPSVQYVTDRLHARGHVDSWCLANCAPDAEVNREARLI